MGAHLSRHTRAGQPSQRSSTNTAAVTCVTTSNNSAAGKPLNLTQLPEEILLQIFREVHGSPVPEQRRTLSSKEQWISYAEGTRSIQNSRLTCRKLNSISSEFLIKLVVVEMNRSSLDRLQNIMQHPTIGRGVSVIRIRLRGYDCSWDMAIPCYIRYMMLRLRSLTPHMNEDMGWYARALYAAWVMNQDDVFEEAQSMASAEHKRRFREQQDLMGQPFCSAVAAALAMSTTRLKVELTDRHDASWKADRDLMQASEKDLLGLVMRPRGCAWSCDHGRFGLAPRNLSAVVPSLVTALADQGVRLAELHLDFTTVKDESVLYLTDAQARRTRAAAAAAGLHKFSFTTSAPRKNTSTGLALAHYAGACLAPDALQGLALRCVRLPPQPPRWANLREIRLVNVEVGAGALELLLRPLEPHAAAVRLEACVLSGGRWCAVLDLLRRRQRGAVLERPLGAECKTLAAGESNYLFVHLPDWHGGTSKAEQYIRGWADVNPLQQHCRSQG